jgi:hypothetical protein
MAQRRSWNTPQAVLSSPWINAQILWKIWKHTGIQAAPSKFVRIVSQSKPTTLKDVYGAWIQEFPEDEGAWESVLFRETRFLTVQPLTPPAATSAPRGFSSREEGVTDAFSCLGPHLWVGTAERSHLTDLNGAPIEELNALFAFLAGEVPAKSSRAWQEFRNGQGEVLSMTRVVSEAIFSERSLRCRQFPDIQSVIYFITEIAEGRGMRRRDVMPMLQRVREYYVLTTSMTLSTASTRLKGGKM